MIRLVFFSLAGLRVGRSSQWNYLNWKQEDTKRRRRKERKQKTEKGKRKNFERNTKKE